MGVFAISQPTLPEISMSFECGGQESSGWQLEGRGCPGNDGSNVGKDGG